MSAVRVGPLFLYCCLFVTVVFENRRKEKESLDVSTLLKNSVTPSFTIKRVSG